MSEAPPTATRWARFFSHLRDDLSVYLCTFILCGLHRAGLIAAYVDHARPPEVASAMATGARFDSVVASLVCAPSLAIALVGLVVDRDLPATMLRRLTAEASWLFLCLWLAIDTAFFAEMGRHLDHRIWSLSPNESEVWATIWQHHHPLIVVACAVVAFATVSFVARSTSPTATLAAHQASRFRWPLLLLAAMSYLFAVRGSVGITPIRVRNAFVTTDATLNQTIPSPFASLLHHLEEQQASTTTVSDAELLAAANLVGENAPQAQIEPRNWLSMLQRKAAGVTAEMRPSHVFVFVLEGQHGFPLLPRFRSSTGAENSWQPTLERLAERGTFFPHFLSTGHTTDVALSALIAGVYTTEWNALHHPRMQGPLPTSLAPHFRRLGYKTRFFYGGYLGWSRIGAFALGQGFEEVYGAPHVRSAMSQAIPSTWGVLDEFLFEFVGQTVQSAEPSLNLVLTTTNHSPYDLGELSTLPKLGPSTQLGALPPDENLLLQHERYVDQELGKLLQVLGQRFPKALFVVTADHPSRRLRHGGLTEREQQAVPLVMAGASAALPWALPSVVQAGGATLDIAATLYELCAPAGFVYTSLGAAMQRRSLDAWALGPNRAHDGKQIVDLQSRSVHAMEDFAASVSERRRNQAQAIRDATTSLTQGLLSTPLPAHDMNTTWQSP